MDFLCMLFGFERLGLLLEEVVKFALLHRGCPSKSRVMNSYKEN